jgi:EmrB/QacA subfamily drug resistance transporter
VTAGTEAGSAGHRFIAFILAFALFMDFVDATILATALPTIARDLTVPVEKLSTLLTAYLLALAIFIPISGWLADRWGARNVFAAGLIAFVASSLLCAASGSLSALIAARFAQGAAGAIMVPVSRLILLRSVRKAHMVNATSWLIMPSLLGPIIGPPLGGLIVTHLDWRWIFYVNLPFGVAGAALVLAKIPDLRESRRRPLELGGLLLSAMSLGALLLGFEAAGRPGEAMRAVLLLLGGLGVGLLYVAYARRAAHPVLDLRLLGDHSFRLSLMAGALTRVTQGAQPFLLPLMLQVGFGFSPTISGAIIVALPIGALSAKAVATPMLRRLGFRNSLIVNGIGGPICYGLAGCFSASTPVPLMVAVLLLAGFFMSFQFSAYNVVAFESIEPERMSAASSFYFTFQQLQLSFGVCAGAFALQAIMAAAGRTAPAAGDFGSALLAASLVTLAATLVHMRFAPDAGAAMSGRATLDELSEAQV